MQVYCSHFDKILTKGSNYYNCPSCRQGWYASASVPVVVIGYTDIYEVSPNYDEKFEKKDLSKKQFKRCKYCKDLLEKRIHVLCRMKTHLEVFNKRHEEFIANIMLVIKGFK